MTVALTIVGIFYTANVDVSSLTNSGQTSFSVRQVLDLAVAQTGNDGATLSYAYTSAFSSNSQATDQGGNNYVDFIAATYPNGVTSFSGNTYPAGTYALGQTASNFAAPSYTVWQYYLFDGNGTVVTVGSSPELPFDQTNAVQDGYAIVWRLVTVASAPVTLNPRVDAILGITPQS